MSNTHKIVRIPDFEAINILVNSKMDIKQAIDKSVQKERIDNIGYHNLEILSRILNHHDDKSSFAVYTSYMDKSKIGSNLFNLKKKKVLCIMMMKIIKIKNCMKNLLILILKNFYLKIIRLFM